MTMFDTAQRNRAGDRRNGLSRQQAEPAGAPEGRATQEAQQQPAAPVNVGGNERMVSVAAGAIAALMGLKRASLPGLLVAGVGGAMVYRGVTGHCPMYQAMGLDTAHESDRDQAEEDLNEHGIKVASAFLINRPPEQLYTFWRNFENLPRIMDHLDSVKTFEDGRRSHWVANLHSIAGKRFEWDAEITADEPNRRIAWRSSPGADVDHSGEVRFQKGLGDRGTEVHVEMNYLPPGGRVGQWIASLSGSNPKRVIREDLRNFKRLIELGEIPTIIGQPHGTCTGQGEYLSETPWKPLFL